MATLEEAEDLVDTLRSESLMLRTNCESFTYYDPTEDACAAAADALDRFLDEGAQRLLARGRAGDAAAVEQLAAACMRLLGRARDIPAQVQEGSRPQDLLADLARDAARFARSSSLHGTVGFVVGALAVLLVLRR